MEESHEAEKSTLEQSEVEPESLSSPGVYRAGKCFVMRRGAELPECCVMSGEPNHGRMLKRRVTWTPSGMYFLLVLLLLPFLGCLVVVVLFALVIVVLVAQKSAKLEFPVSDVWLAKRRQRLIFGWGLIASVIPIFFLLRTFGSSDGWLVGIAVAAVAVCAGLVVLYPSQFLRAEAISGDVVWLRGAHPDFIAQLPEL